MPGGAAGLGSIRALESAPGVRTGNGDPAGNTRRTRSRSGQRKQPKKGFQGMTHTMAAIIKIRGFDDFRFLYQLL